MKNLIIAGDTKILHLINSNFHCNTFSLFFKYFTHLGGASFSITTSLLAFFIIPQKASNIVFFSLALSHLLVRIIKKVVCRLRPYVNSNVKYMTPLLKDYSFPSGHSASSFALATSLGILIPILSPYLYFMAILVCISRIYLGHHYPTDTIIGATIGYISAIIVSLA